jgi:hypothetical protein
MTIYEKLKEGLLQRFGNVEINGNKIIIEE